jgi:chorismate dehydratase
MTPTPLRIAAINFLNPAPLMWDFEHGPLAPVLAERYRLKYTAPSLCAEQVHSGEADLGLIPVAAVTSDLAVVPGCVIASTDRVRSIQLILRADPSTGRSHTLASVRTLAADTASRSSVAYAQVLLHRAAGVLPQLVSYPADAGTMLGQTDAALLIGDPALLALESRTAIEAAVGPCTWIDVAEAWHQLTGLPWVAAVWSVRPESLARSSVTPAQLIADLNESRIHGLEHIDDLVRHWTPRIAIPPATIREYLTRNIHYHLDPECIRAIELFRRYAAEIGVLPPLPELRLLDAARPPR